MQFSTSMRCFNSNLVRLRVTIDAAVVVSSTVFQFQSGAIKRSPACKKFFSLDKFQFQSGAIKSFSFLIKRNKTWMFQFQSGAIKRIDKPSLMSFASCFNSNLVRLRVTLLYS